MKNIEMLINEIESLADFERKHPNFLYTPLAGYITKWFRLTDREKAETLPILNTFLFDGQDCDHMGTPWKKEWLENGKICFCPACNTARDCIAIIKNSEEG